MKTHNSVDVAFLFQRISIYLSIYLVSLVIKISAYFLISAYRTAGHMGVACPLAAARYAFDGIDLFATLNMVLNARW